MFLNRLRKPKWQHADPQVRMEAVQALDAADPVLTQIAREDEHPGVRRAALVRIGDLDLLRRIAAEDPEAGVRDTAAARIKNLMTGKTPDSPPLATRLAALDESHSAALLAFLAVEGTEAPLRLAALARTDQAAIWEKLAVRDPALEVRLAALERIADEPALENVVRQTRSRDKRVYRQARERLSALRAARAHVEHADRLCAEMEGLADAAAEGTEPDLGRFHRLETSWQAAEPTLESDLRERYRQARERFQRVLEERAARRAERRELCQSLEDLVSTLEAESELAAALEQRVTATLQQARAQWDRHPDTDKAEHRRFAELLDAVAARERALRRNHERAERLRAVLAGADALLHQPSEVREADLTELKRQWKALERPESGHLAATLQAGFEAALDRLRARLQRQADRKEQERAEILALLDHMETALKEGALQQAITCRDQARQHLQQNIGLSRREMTALEQRLHACLPQMDELRDWRRWGTNQAREGLCGEAERLIGSADDPAALAGRIKQLRAIWKTLDSNTGPAPRVLWNRFDTACERAYQPCQTHFEALAGERQANLEQKQSLCQRLEAFTAETDWTQADWHTADQIYRQAQSEWRKIGPVNRSEQKALERRFTKALEGLNTHLEQERGHELQRRQALIERVRALAESDDLRAAIDEVKRAQTEWQPTVLAPRRREQALWREFRAACDAVFERRQAERQALDEERQAHLARKVALCEEIETLGDEALAQAKAHIRQAHEAWEALGPVPRDAQREIEKRFAAACAGLERRAEEGRRARARRELENLREHAALCAWLEALAVIDTPPEPAEIEQAQARREALPALPEPLAAPMQRRFETAWRTLTEGTAARQALQQRLEQDLETRRTLCLQMEILAGVNSPAEFAQARMAYQVARLSESLGARDSESRAIVPDKAQALERQWYLLSAPPSPEYDALAARFEGALATLEK